MTNRKGILLAGGSNTRLYPSTRATAKSLLPIYDKPLIYYPLATLMQAGIRDILLITSPAAQAAHHQLLGDGADWGLRLSYAVQPQPRGIADAFIIGRDFIAASPCTLLLGDNIFYGGNMATLLHDAAQVREGAVIFARHTDEPQRFGIVEIAADGGARSLEEKPAQPKSSYAVTGCYFYDSDVCGYAASLAPSARNELEITDINQLYLDSGRLSVQRLDRETCWFDAGTPDSLLQAGTAVAERQHRHHTLIACLEEIAWRQGWISDAQLGRQAQQLKNTAYGDYLGGLMRQQGRKSKFSSIRRGQESGTR